jgi:hypothetical protein
MAHFDEEICIVEIKSKLDSNLRNITVTLGIKYEGEKLYRKNDWLGIIGEV